MAGIVKREKRKIKAYSLLWHKIGKKGKITHIYRKRQKFTSHCFIFNLTKSHESNEISSAHSN